MSDRRDPSQDLYLAFLIGAAAAFYLVLPAPLKTAAFHGALVGKVVGVAAALIRRHQAATKPSWIATLLVVPPFAVGAAAGFVLVTWLATHLPSWIARLA